MIVSWDPNLAPIYLPTFFYFLLVFFWVVLAGTIPKMGEAGNKAAQQQSPNG
jgi:hypothetical protein